MNITTNNFVSLLLNCLNIRFFLLLLILAFDVKAIEEIWTGPTIYCQEPTRCILYISDVTEAEFVNL